MFAKKLFAITLATSTLGPFYMYSDISYISLYAIVTPKNGLDSALA